MSRYKKIVEISTGVVTRIADTLEGKVHVSYHVTDKAFLEPIKIKNEKLS